MLPNKPWYTSKTIWASLAALLTSGAGFLNIQLGADAEATLSDSLMQIATSVAALIAIYGRVTAKNRIEPFRLPS
jgi:hypothetical protein